MSKAAKLLRSLTFCRNERPHTWSARAEATLRALAANIIAGNHERI